jgi:hypothetical protein
MKILYERCSRSESELEKRIKADGFVIYCSDEATAFKTDPNDSSGMTVEERGVDFLDNGVILPYVRNKGEMAVFAGFPFHYTIKEAENGKGG